MSGFVWVCVRVSVCVAMIEMSVRCKSKKGERFCFYNLDFVFFLCFHLFLHKYALLNEQMLNLSIYYGKIVS